MSCLLGRFFRVVLGLIATRQFRKTGFSARARAWSNNVNINAQYHHRTHLVIACNKLGNGMSCSITRVCFHILWLLQHPIKRLLGHSCHLLVYLHLPIYLPRKHVVIHRYVSLFTSFLVYVIMLTDVCTTA